MDLRDINLMHPKLAPDGAAAAAPGGPLPDPADHQLDLVAEVHTRVRDLLEGFETMEGRAEAQFLPVVRDFIALHREHESELAGYLVRQGRDPDADGSFTGTVQKVLVAVKSWFENIDDGEMTAIKQGEKHLLEGYEQARQADLPAHADEMLGRHEKEIDAIMRRHAA